MTKVYRFVSTKNNRYNINKLWTKTYILSGIKTAIKLSNWVSDNKDYIEVVEYELKEVRRLALEEVKQLNNKTNTNKHLELLELISSTFGITIEFYSCSTGTMWIDNGSNSIEFNSLEEAIELVNRYSS